MISRGLSSGKVCLGCRLRLLHQVNRPNISQAISRSPAVHWPRVQRWFASEASASTDEPGWKPNREALSALDKSSETDEQSYQRFLKEEDVTPKHDDTHAARPRHRPRPQAIEKEENYRAVRHLDLGKKHLSGKKVLTETSASLGTAMLGKPAYAIVMRDGGLYRKKKRQVVTQDLRRETLDVDALLHARFDPPTNAEVRENINELRPQDSETYLKAKDFHTIQLQLEEGFLKRQLFHYLQAHRSVKSNPTAATRNVPLQRTEDEQLRLQYPWIKKVAPWTPSGRHDEVDLSDSLLLGYVSSDTTPKARAAIQLMRECWGLQIEEIAHGLGELKVGLHTSYFMPFMRDAQRFIQSISESYLEEGETIEALVDTKEIRIVAPKPKCATILAEVDSLIAKITTETIPVHHVTADVSKLTKELLEQVGRVTNTNVHLSKSRNVSIFHSWGPSPVPVYSLRRCHANGLTRSEYHGSRTRPVTNPRPRLYRMSYSVFFRTPFSPTMPHGPSILPTQRERLPLVVGDG